MKLHNNSLVQVQVQSVSNNREPYKLGKEFEFEITMEAPSQISENAQGKCTNPETSLNTYRERNTKRQSELNFSPVLKLAYTQKLNYRNSPLASPKYIS